MPPERTQREGTGRRATDCPAEHCETHDAMHETLTKVATNTDWIVRGLKWSLSLASGIVVLVVIPVALFLVNLDKRVTTLEMRLNLHVSPEKSK